MVKTVEELQEQVKSFMDATMDARSLSERDRDYYDHKQWSERELAVLRARKQAPIVNNRIKPKVDGLVGLYILRTTDPKAFPRTEKHEDAAHVITDGLRYVADNTDFETTKQDVAENVFIEGYGGVIVDVKQKGDEVEIDINRIPWDRIYYDPHSTERDYADVRFNGIYHWMDEDVAQDAFPKVDVSELISQMDNDSEGDTFDDKPNDWIDQRNRRIRVAQHFHIENNTWMMSFFTGDTFLVEPAPSPYLDEDGLPSNPIELVCAFIDRDNDRYGEVRGFIDTQDEINHRRSKSIHLMGSRQTASRQGAVKDLTKLKREMQKPDGHVEYTGERGDFEILDTNDMTQSQFLMYQDAKAELDAKSFNAQLAGERQSGDLSGVAIDKLQKAGTIELNGLYNRLANWEKRVHSQVWARIKQFWNEEKWIRVTDDQKNLRWVGLNSQITGQKFLEEKINDESLPLEERQQASAAFTFLMNSQDPQAQAKLQEIVEVKNDTSELDVDIIIEQSFDSVNIQQEQFALMAKFAQGQDIDIIELIELSDLRGKDELIEKIESRRQSASEAAGNAQQLNQQVVMSDVALNMSSAKLKEQQAIEQRLNNQKLLNGTEDLSKVTETMAKAQKIQQEAIQKALENRNLAVNPDPNPQVFI